MDKTVRISIIVTVVVLLVIGAVSVVLFLLYRRHWPVKFSITANSPNVVYDMYGNDMAYHINQRPSQGETKQYEIGNHTIYNIRTEKYVGRNQLKSVVIRFYNDADAYIDFGNLKPTSITLSADQSNLTILDNNSSALKSGNLTQAGWYHYSFPAGIPLF